MNPAAPARVLAAGPGSRSAAGPILALVAGSGVVAAVAPQAVALLGVLVLGPLHVVFELRYVLASAPALRRGHLALAAQSAALAAGVGRVMGLPRWPEVLVLGLLCAAPVVWVGRGRDVRGTGATPVGRAAAAGAIAAVTIAAAAAPLWVIVVLAHVHNLVPVGVMGRRAGRSIQLLFATCYLGAAAMLLGGGLPAAALEPAGQRAAVLVTPPPLVGGGDGPARWLALFGFTQLVHYGLWIWYLPRFHDAPWRQLADEPFLARCTTWRLVVAAGVVSLALVTVAAMASPVSARALYQAAAAYHVVLEAPALAVLLARRTG